MNLRSIVTYRSMKDMNAREIHTDMNDILGTDCVGYSTVTKFLKARNFSKSMLDTDFEPKIEEENFIDEAILGALEKYPFSSLRQIAKRMFIPMGMVSYRLVNSWGYQIRNTRWVPHSLSSSPKQGHVEMSQDFLQVRRPAKHHACKYIVRLDEAWVYFSNRFDRIWLPQMNCHHLSRNKRLQVRN
jgi:hypothetical protein